MNYKRSSKSGKSGIVAIDQHYDQLDIDNEVEHLRYTTEFKRLVSQIRQHWKANKFPLCEQNSVKVILNELMELANFKSASDKVIDQLEDYLKFIRDFTNIENKLKNLVI